MVTENFEPEQSIANIKIKLKDKIQKHGYIVMGVNGFATYSLGVSLKPETPFEFVVDTTSAELGAIVNNELVHRVNEGETFQEGKAYESTKLKLAKGYDPKEGDSNIKTKFMVLKVTPWVMFRTVTFWWEILSNYTGIETCYLVILADKDNILPLELEGSNKDDFVETFFLNKTNSLDQVR